MSDLSRKVWPEERRLINKVIKQKGYITKPYPKKKRIPEKAGESLKGALDLLDEAEKKKPAKGKIMKYRREHEHQRVLPSADKSIRNTVKTRSGSFNLSRKGVVVGKSKTNSGGGENSHLIVRKGGVRRRVPNIAAATGMRRDIFLKKGFFPAKKKQRISVS